MSELKLPPEVLQMIALYVEDTADKLRLLNTSMAWYEIMRPLLYSIIRITDSLSASLLARTFSHLVNPWIITRMASGRIEVIQLIREIRFEVRPDPIADALGHDSLINTIGRIDSPTEVVNDFNPSQVNQSEPISVNSVEDDDDDEMEVFEEVQRDHIPPGILPLLPLFKSLRVLVIEATCDDVALAQILGPSSILRQQLEVLHLHNYAATVPWLFVAPAFIGVFSARIYRDHSTGESDSLIEPNQPNYEETVEAILKEASEDVMKFQNVEFREDIDPSTKTWGETTPFSKLTELSLSLDCDIAIGTCRSLFETDVVKNLKSLSLTFETLASPGECLKMVDFDFTTMKYACKNDVNNLPPELDVKLLSEEEILDYLKLRKELKMGDYKGPRLTHFSMDCFCCFHLDDLDQ